MQVFGGDVVLMNPKNRRFLRPLSTCLVFVVSFFTLAGHASAEWKEKVLYSFQGTPDGSLPGGGVVFDQAGNLYGVTAEGGSSSCAPAQCGIVYQLTPPAQKGRAWTETVLYIFKGHQFGDGSSPAGTLVIDSSGNLYGGTAYGGTGDCMLAGGAVGCGTVYELSPPKEKGGAWTETVLYSFKGGKDGQLAGQTLTFDSHGNLYGATTYGGGYGSCNAPYYQHCGTIYELSPPKTKGGKWTEKVLYSFKSGQDGAGPNGGLVVDTKGALYGTTFMGGYNCPHHSGNGCGTIFELKPPVKKIDSWTEKQIHVFKNGSDGSQPSSGVIFGAKAFLYGAAEGGLAGGGVVFRLQVASSGRWTETVLYGFRSDTYYYDPTVSGFDSSGNLYGSTNVGPGESFGSVFRLKPTSREEAPWMLSVLYGFAGGSDGSLPIATATFDKSGNLYGATEEGGGMGTCQGYCGTVFEVEP